VAAVLARVDVLAPRKGEKQKARKPVEGATDIAPRELICQGCGETLPREARFCMACGKKVAS
jgi:predicted amidophosphoribosyltransferase